MLFKSHTYLSLFYISRMPGKLDIASMLKKSVQNIEQTASDKAAAPVPAPGPSKAKNVKKVSERKPKTAKKPAADKKAAAPRKKIGVKEKSKEKKSKPIKEKKDKKEDTPFEEKVWQLDQVGHYSLNIFSSMLTNYVCSTEK